MRGTLVDQGRNHDVLECHSGAVEHESVTRRLPGWLPADDDFPEFGVHIAALHGARAAPALMSYACTSTILLTAAMLRSCTRPWSPQPTIVTTDGSSRDRYFAATAVAAPVRIIVIWMASMMASGVPLLRSASTMTP